MHGLRTPLALFVCVAVAGASASPAQEATAQEGPALVRDAFQALPLTRGIALQTFRIDSSILEETRVVHVVLPPSFARSAPERRYPVTIVLDGEDNVPSAAAVSAELARNGQIPEMLIVAIPNVEGTS